jgi:hypothetical protein
MPPLNISEIRITQTRTSNTSGQLGKGNETAVVSLAEKMDEYIFKLGCSSAHTLGVMVQLLSVGKIRLDFREYSERLQLENPQDLLPRTEAMQLTEAYLATMREGLPAPAEALDATQKIIVQAPKRTVL